MTPHNTTRSYMYHEPLLCTSGYHIVTGWAPLDREESPASRHGTDSHLAPRLNFAVHASSHAQTSRSTSIAPQPPTRCTNCTPTMYGTAQHSSFPSKPMPNPTRSHPFHGCQYHSGRWYFLEPVSVRNRGRWSCGGPKRKVKSKLGCGVELCCSVTLEINRNRRVQ